MNLLDLIKAEYRAQYPSKDFADLKPALIAFIEGCMQRAEREGPFSEKVRQMRHWQKKYFAHRSKDYLDNSKALEKEIDDLLTPKKALPQQGGLF
jgi:hypothetical protein